MPAQRPPGRGKFPPRSPRPTSGHAETRHPRPATTGPSDRKSSPPRRADAPSSPHQARPAPRARSNQNSPSADRLQKILAHAGVGSRRACEELILQGRVTVGGQVVKELGTKVDLAKISVAVDGQKIQQERLVYFAVNKPKGYVSTNNDPAGRPRVLDLMPEISQRVYTVGRLDEMSVGLMLLTNDGELANKLAHPKFGVEKLYRVIVAGTPERETLNQLTEGIWLAEGKVRAKRVRAVAKKGDATILEMVLAEGKNREVRRMLAKLGHKVMMLTRVAVGPITLKGLTVGQFRPLTGREVDLLRRVAAGEPVVMPWATDRRPRPEGDRPRRAVGTSPGAERRPPRDISRPSGPPASTAGPGRPHGPGYRGNDSAEERRAGPGAGRPANGPADRRPSGGPPRRPGMFQAEPESRERRFQDDRRPMPPRPAGSRPGPGGPPPGSRGGERSGGGHSTRPPFTAGESSRPPRPGGPRPGGNRPYQGNNQRPPGPGGSRPPMPTHDRRPGGTGGSRPPQTNDRRDQQSGGASRSASEDRRNQRPPGGGERRPPANRRLPIPGSAEPTRKVIGLSSQPAPAPEPSDDRPKARLKRPAPRGGVPSGPRPMPKRRNTSRNDD